MTKTTKTTTENKMLIQYKNLKKKHPDTLILFRCGDFYDTYQEDARAASEILGITLTKSSKLKDEEGQALVMAGFPFHALDTYLPKLIRAGKRVAIYDQLEDERKPTREVEPVAQEESQEASTPAQEEAQEKQPEDMTIAELLEEIKALREERANLKEQLQDNKGTSAIELKEAEERASRESAKAELWMKRAMEAEEKLENIMNIAKREDK